MKKKTHRQNNSDDDYFMYTQTHRRRKPTSKKVAHGEWSIKENKIYVQFLQCHRELFQTEFKRRSKRVFRKMSSMMRRRDPQQCRSHHQKYSHKFKGSIDKVIDYIHQKIKHYEEKNVAKQIVLQNKKIQQKTGGRNEIAHDSFVVTQEILGQFKIVINLNDIQFW